MRCAEGNKAGRKHKERRKHKGRSKYKVKGGRKGKKTLSKWMNRARGI